MVEWVVTLVSEFKKIFGILLKNWNSRAYISSSILILTSVRIWTTNTRRRIRMQCLCEQVFTQMVAYLLAELNYREGPVGKIPLRKHRNRNKHTQMVIDWEIFLKGPITRSPSVPTRPNGTKNNMGTNRFCWDSFDGGFFFYGRKKNNWISGFLKYLGSVTEWGRIWCTKFENICHRTFICFTRREWKIYNNIKMAIKCN